MGEIPPDAIVGGHDANGKETYIGQAYIISSKLKSRSAIIPVEIHQGIASVDVPIFGVRENTTTDIKVGTMSLLFAFVFNLDARPQAVCLIVLK